MRLEIGIVVSLGTLSGAACGGDLAKLRSDGVTVELSLEDGLVIRRDGAVLLASHRGTAIRAGDETRPGRAYAPFAAAATERRDVDETYGFFRFDEEVGPFRRLRPSDIRKEGRRIRFTVGERGEGSIRFVAPGVIRIHWRDGESSLDRLAMTFACQPGDRFFGLGAQVSAEHRGYRVPIWTTEQGVSKAARGEPPLVFGLTGAHYDSYAPVPFTLVSRPVGLWLDADAWSELELCEHDERLRLETWGPSFDLVVYTQPSMAEALAAFTADTGRPEPVPPWIFGPWIDAFGGPAAIGAAVSTLRGHGIPASALWAEDWVGTTTALGGENLTYDWEEDPLSYPDLAAVTASVHAAGLRFLAYVNPFLPEDAAVQPAAAAANVLVRDSAGAPMTLRWPWGPPVSLFDPTATAAAAFFDETLGRAAAQGVDGWMADYGEALPFVAQLADGSAGAAAHNRFPRLWAETNKRFWQAHRPDGDWAIFSRSGHTGIAAATRIHWLGDQNTSFDRNDGLGSVVPLYLSAGLSGIALTHSDVGGYTSFANAVRTHELFARWLALEAFTPFLRTHHTSNPAANLQWSSDAETLAWVERYFRWHQRLAPYFAMVAGEAVRSGAPAVRPLWWGDEGRTDLFAVEDAFLTGNALLVAPIVVAGQSQRTVPLPAERWRRWSTLDGPLDPPLSGGESIAAPPGEIIVLVRAGAVVPLLAEDYDSLAPARAGDGVDPALRTAPPVIDRLRLLLVGGGDDDGALEAPGFAALAWQWRGGDVAAGPIVAASAGGEPMPACVSPVEGNCLDGDRLRLGAERLDGVLISMQTAAGTASLAVHAADVAELVVEIR